MGGFRFSKTRKVHLKTSKTFGYSKIKSPNKMQLSNFTAK